MARSHLLSIRSNTSFSTQPSLNSAADMSHSFRVYPQRARFNKILPALWSLFHVNSLSFPPDYHP